MATIRLNNLVKPRQINNPKVGATTEESTKKSTYTDLHLDLQVQNNVGLGNNPRQSSDIKVDNDMEAIKNSIRNIFNTKNGQKLLTPDFGSSLEKFLFERADDFTGSIIANTVLENIQKFEPRIEVLKIRVYPVPDDNMFRMFLFYRFISLDKQETLEMSVLNDGQIII